MPNRILAIDPGTRFLGYAALEETKLTYHGVKTMNPKGSPQERLREARLAVSCMIGDLKPCALAIEDAYFANNRRAALVTVLVDELAALGRRKGVRVVLLPPSTVKKQIAGNGRASKRDVANAVIARFPELRPYRSSDRAWKTRFHGNMLDAVAVGLAAQRNSAEIPHCQSRQVQS